jgi:hypothetical protein
MTEKVSHVSSSRTLVTRVPRKGKSENRPSSALTTVRCAAADGRTGTSMLILYELRRAAVGRAFMLPFAAEIESAFVVGSWENTRKKDDLLFCGASQVSPKIDRPSAIEYRARDRMLYKKHQ